MESICQGNDGLGILVTSGMWPDTSFHCFAAPFAFALASSMIGWSFFLSAGIELKSFLKVGVGIFVFVLIDADDAAVNVGVGVFRLHA
jgi:hypothetical protein